MIDKEEFYRGAVLALLLEDNKCETIRRYGKGGYIAHETFFQVRFTTKARSPWRFNITQVDIARFQETKRNLVSSLLVLVCGGDGVCVISSEELSVLLNDQPGWLAVKRGHNKQYEVNGSCGKLEYKVACNRWPAIIFENKGV